MKAKQKGCMTEAQLAKVFDVHRKTGRRLGWAAVELGFIREEDLLKALSAQLSLPYMRVTAKQLPREIVFLIPELVARRRHMIPVERKEEGRLVLAMADPLDERARREAQLITGMEIAVVISLEGEISACLDHFYGPGRLDPEPSADAFHKKIGEFLLEGGFITQDQLQAAGLSIEHPSAKDSVVAAEVAVLQPWAAAHVVHSAALAGCSVHGKGAVFHYQAAEADAHPTTIGGSIGFNRAVQYCRGGVVAINSTTENS